MKSRTSNRSRSSRRSRVRSSISALVDNPQARPRELPVLCGVARSARRAGLRVRAGAGLWTGRGARRASRRSSGHLSPPVTLNDRLQPFAEGERGGDQLRQLGCAGAACLGEFGGRDNSVIAGVDQALAATGQASQRAAGASGGVTVGVGVGTEQRNLSVVAPSQFTFSSRSPDFVDETAGQSWCAILGLNQFH